MPELWMLKVMNVNYQDTTQGNYVEPTLTDVGNLPNGQSYQWLRANQTSEFPLLNNRGSQFEIFPAPSSTLKGNNLTKFFYIMYFVAPTPYVATTDTVAYPFNLNQNVLASRMAWMQALRGNTEAQQRATEYQKNYLSELDNLENVLKRGSQKSTTPTGVPLNGYEF